MTIETFQRLIEEAGYLAAKETLIMTGRVSVFNGGKKKVIKSLKELNNHYDKCKKLSVYQLYRIERLK